MGNRTPTPSVGWSIWPPTCLVEKAINKLYHALHRMCNANRPRPTCSTHLFLSPLLSPPSFYRYQMDSGPRAVVAPFSQCWLFPCMFAGMLRQPNLHVCVQFQVRIFVVRCNLWTTYKAHNIKMQHFEDSVKNELLYTWHACVYIQVHQCDEHLHFHHILLHDNSDP